MLRAGILNPHIGSLLAHVRHTNSLVIADRGFPFWPQIETIGISLVDDIPRVLDVLRAVRASFVIGRVFLAEEFQSANAAEKCREFMQSLDGIALSIEPHVDLKKRVPASIGLIRTGDTTQYANLIFESA